MYGEFRCKLSPKMMLMPRCDVLMKENRLVDPDQLVRTGLPFQITVDLDSEAASFSNQATIYLWRKDSQ